MGSIPPMALCFITLLFLSSPLFLPSPFCTSTDTISINQPLRDGDLIISAAKTFALGFFTPPGNPNGQRYIGIWYNTIPEQTLVWVANRNNPISGTTGVLHIDSITRNLVLRDERTNISVWTTGVSFPGSKEQYFSAQLLDTGNLVLFFENDNDSDSNNDDDEKGFVGWQSFDHPTNTILPSMKFGGGVEWVMRSWKAAEDPGDGQYVFRLEAGGGATGGVAQGFMYRGSERIWRAGPWTGFGWSGVPEMKTRFFFHVTQKYSIEGPSVYSRIVLNESGKMEGLTWNAEERKWVGFWFAPMDQCDDYAHCGAFSSCNPYRASEEFECECLPGFEPRAKHDWGSRDGLRGCERKKGAQDVCENGGFEKLVRMKIPDTEVSVSGNMSMGIQECREMCSRNCSCTGYSSANVSDDGGGGIGCIAWYGELLDMKEFTNSGGQDMYVRVSASELAKISKKSGGNCNETRNVVIMIVSLVATILALYLVCYLVMKKKKKKTTVKEGGESDTEQRLDSTLASSCKSSSVVDDMYEGGTTDLSIFDLETIISATENFSLKNLLGEGGFGRVFKGQLANGQEIAVKRLSRNSGQGAEEFKNEVTLIAKLQHRNLVRLLGCCVQQGEKMLIYEYLPNKGLDCFIFDETRGSILDWKKRFNIILGIARAMLYLHQDSRLRIIHRDLKASNVLLDACMHPKISDFGMARIFGGDQIEASTRRVVGTYGYMSPEYAMEGYFSMKSDVYSFGVLLLEIITGRKNSQYHESSINLVGYVWDSWREDKALDVVDANIENSYDSEEVLRCIHIGLLCVQALQNDRPTMSDVVFMLCNETTLSSPNPPGFIGRKSGNYFATTSNISAAHSCVSVNDMSITMIEGR